MGKTENAKFLQDLSVAMASIRFASRMKRRANAKKSPAKSPSEEPVKTSGESDAQPTKCIVPPSAKVPSSAVEGAAAPTMELRFEGTLQLFTADLEKAFLVQLAKYVDVPAEHLHVLSRTAGSVILSIAVHGEHAERALGAIADAELTELSEALGQTMLSKRVLPLTATKPAPVTTVPATPEYKAIA